MEPNVFWHIHKSMPLVPIHSRINPVHIIPSNFLRLNIVFSSQLHQYLPSGVIRLASNALFV